MSVTSSMINLQDLQAHLDGGSPAASSSIGMQRRMSTTPRPMGAMGAMGAMSIVNSNNGVTSGMGHGGNEKRGTSARMSVTNAGELSARRTSLSPTNIHHTTPRSGADNASARQIGWVDQSSEQSQQQHPALTIDMPLNKPIPSVIGPYKRPPKTAPANLQSDHPSHQPISRGSIYNGGISGMRPPGTASKVILGKAKLSYRDVIESLEGY
jgi:hypothetical protein